MDQEEYGRAYDKLFETTIHKLVSAGIKPTPAREFAQAAWAQGWERLYSLRSPEKISAWIFVIALNLFRNSTHLREDPIGLFENISFDPRRKIEDHIEAEQMLARSKRENNNLLRNFYFDGKTCLEMAQEAGASEIAIRVRLARARQNIRKQVDGTR